MRHGLTSAALALGLLTTSACSQKEAAEAPHKAPHNDAIIGGETQLNSAMAADFNPSPNNGQPQQEVSARNETSFEIPAEIKPLLTGAQVTSAQNITFDAKGNVQKLKISFSVANINCKALRTMLNEPAVTSPQSYQGPNAMEDMQGLMQSPQIPIGPDTSDQDELTEVFAKSLLLTGYARVILDKNSNMLPEIRNSLKDTMPLPKDLSVTIEAQCAPLTYGFGKG